MRQKREQNSAKRKKRRSMMIILLVIACLIISWCIYAVYISYHTLQVVSYTYPCNVNQDITLCVMSDLHNNEINAENQIVADEAAKMNPELICAMGDMIDGETEDYDPILSLMDRLLNIAPVVYSLGNQEKKNEGWEGLKSQLEAKGVLVLDKSYKDFDIDGSVIRIGAMYSYTFSTEADNKVDEEKMSKSTVSFLKSFQQTDYPRILLCHRPDSLVLNQSGDYWGIDLVLSGHDHGGQVVLPGIGGIFGGDLGFFSPYIYGENQFGKTTIITTSGLGSGEEKLPRFNNPCEMMKVTLAPENGNE